MIRTIITAAAIGLVAGPAFAVTPDQTGMMRASLSQSLGSYGIERTELSDLSLIDLATLRHIVEGGHSEGQKAFRARAFMDKTE